MDTLKLWAELTEDERREVIGFMKRRRTKYGALDIKMMLIGAAVAIVGWALVSLIRAVLS